MSFDLGIRAGHLLTMKGGLGDVATDQFIGIKDGLIIEVAPFQSSQQKAAGQFYDLSSKIVLPGLINAHTHLSMVLFRGYEDDRPFQEWLFKYILPLEAKSVREEFIRVGTSLAALESIRFGTTFVNDMYFFCNTAADVLIQSGLRAHVAWPFMDFETPEERSQGPAGIQNRVSNFKKFCEKYATHPRVRPAIGPHAPYSCSDNTLREVEALSREMAVPIHIHLSESQTEFDESLKKYGKSPTKRLHDLGLLSPNLIAAHCVHFTDEDIELFKNSGAAMIYNPDSNMKLSSGTAPIARFRKAGIPVALGTDGAASNNDLSMFGAMDIGTKLQKLAGGEGATMGALDALNLATYEGAHALGMGNQIGTIEVGKRADIIALRTDLPHVKPLYSVLSQLVYAYQGLEVDTVICDGNTLFHQDRFLTLDANAIYQDTEKMRLQLRQSF